MLRGAFIGHDVLFFRKVSPPVQSQFIDRQTDDRPRVEIKFTRLSAIRFNLGHVKPSSLPFAGFFILLVFLLII